MSRSLRLSLIVSLFLLTACQQSVEDCMHDRQGLWEDQQAPGNQLEGSPEFWQALEQCEPNK